MSYVKLVRLLDSKCRLSLWHLKKDVIAMEVLNFSINLVAFYHECRSQIGCATPYLFCCRQCAVVNQVATASWRFQSECEEDLSFIRSRFVCVIVVTGAPSSTIKMVEILSSC